MKLIEGMKKIKELQEKADDYRKKVRQFHVHLSVETPTYGDRQRAQITEWIQGHEGLVKEILHLRVSIQRTNLNTLVDIELDGKRVTKSIAEWIHRRRDLAKLEMEMWEQLNDKNLKEGYTTTSTQEKIDVKIIRYYDPQQKDKAVASLRAEPNIIDRTLEVINATTDLIEK